MSSDLAVIEAEGLSKVYQLFLSPTDRLKQMLFGATSSGSRSFSALSGVGFSLQRGEVLGLVGRNGAGKSTLLQIVCGTLMASSGSLKVRGRVAALLELGAGFNADFSGRENVFLYGAVLGLSRQEMDERFDEIVAFSGIGEFIDQPVKTYSSGMYVRLAFSIATSVDPDILVVDEALSVGDGEFARKSFDRIMSLRERGTTILFCSHSLFQIESICTRAIWLHAGKVVAQGNPAQVVSAYQEFLDSADMDQPGLAVSPQQPAAPRGHARLARIRVGGLGPGQGPLHLVSLTDDLLIDARFASDPALPCPSVAVSLHTPDGRLVGSAGAWNDGVVLQRDASGVGRLQVRFPKLPLLKGRYYVSVHLFCERGLHIYDVADRVMYLVVAQVGLEQGLFHVPRVWSSGSDVPEIAGDTNSSAPLRFDGQVDASVADLLDDLSAQAAPLQVGQSLTLADPQAHGLAALAPRFGLTAQADGSWLKTRAPRWSLGWVRSGSEPTNWLALFETCFGHPMSEAHWRWKYGGQELAGVGVFTQDALVGFYGGLPRQVMVHGVSALALQIGDVMVHPSERGVLTRQGPFFLACTTMLEQLMGFGRPFLLGFGFPNQKALSLAVRQGVYAAVDQVTEISWSVPRMRPDWRVRSRPVSMTDEAAVNACWAEMAQAMKSSILGVRDWQFVVRRFLQHPTVTYTVLLMRARFSGKPLGVVVLRDRGTDGLELMDLIGAPVHFAALVREALRHAHLLGRSRLFAWATLSHRHLLDVWGSESAPLDVWIPANVWSPGPSAAALQDQWWLMGGDTDFR
jgi:lipopolysaccharide transport system ATP-binding protein